LLRRDLSQFFANGLTLPSGSAFVVPWSVAVAAVQTFPADRVLTGALVEDTSLALPSTSGSSNDVRHAFYDLVTVERPDTVH
jgi:hypothetical protein